MREGVMNNKDSDKETQQPRSRIVYQRLKDAIIAGDKLPGTRLIPNDLEKELNIGRVPIREALLELVQTGLVVSEPYKGAVVAPPPTLEEIREIFAIRFMLDGMAAEAAALKMSDRVIVEMEKLHVEMCNYSATSEPYFSLNQEFHMLLYEASGMQHLFQIIKQLIDKVQTFRIRYPFELTDYNMFNQGHAKILSALKAREADKVKEHLVANVRDGLETLVSVYGKYVRRL